MSAQPVYEAMARPDADRGPASSTRRRSPRSPTGHLRVLRIPDFEPPALPPGARPSSPDPRFIQGSLAVDFRPEEHDEFFGPQTTSRSDLPDPDTWARRLITAILETMDGLRPPNQLSRWVSPDIRDRINRRGILARQRRQRPSGPPQVRTLRVCEPADGVAEVAAVISHRARVRALALRMTGVDGRWLITTLELG